MNFAILHVGDPKEAYWISAFEEYKKRMAGRLTDISVKPARIDDESSPAQIAAALKKEADSIEAALKSNGLDGAGTKKVALCIEGRQYGSEEFAALLQGWAGSGSGGAVFIIGSSFGLSDRIKSRCERISFSKMTFPHQLARIIAAEQIYRADCILSNKRYHK